MEPAKLEAFATHIFSGKLARIYTSVEKSAEWETTHSVAEVQIAEVVKGKHGGKLAYVRFWHRRFIGKGKRRMGRMDIATFRRLAQTCAFIRARARMAGWMSFCRMVSR